jgi:hypothetical protein
MMRDPRAFLANLPPLPTLEAFQRHRDLLSSPQSFLSAAAASLRNPGGLMPPTSMSSHMPPFGMSPLQQRPPSQPTTPSSQSSSPVQQNFGGNQQNWSFEEQFKQVRTQTLERRRSNSLFIENKKKVRVSLLDLAIFRKSGYRISPSCDSMFFCCFCTKLLSSTFREFVF